MLTPDEILFHLVRIFPDFKTQWESESNYLNEGWSDVPYHSLFADFSHYFRDNFMEMSERDIQELCDYIEPFVRDDKVHEDIDNAICTCFLENVGGESSTVDLPKYLGPKSLKFYKAWHGL